MASNKPVVAPPATAVTPAPLDRKALERVLARAAELQGTSAGGDAASDRISESQILEIAREVGLSSDSVSQALAEERTRVDLPEESGWLGRVAGPGMVTAARAVSGTQHQVLERIDTWMQRDECLRVQRRFTERIVWEARHDWVGSVKRILNVGGSGYRLARARQVAATVLPLESGRVLVRLDADIATHRSNRIRAGGGTASLGAIAGAGAMAIGAAAHVALLGVLAVGAMPVAIAGAAAYHITRSHRHFAERAQLALEQMLDRLEHGGGRRGGTLLDVINAAAPLLR